MQRILKSDFIAIVGFFAHTAIIDKKLKNKIRKMTITELLDNGYYKEAVSLAFYENNEKDKLVVVEFLRKKQYVESFDSLVREFGIQQGIFDKIQKIKRV